MLYRYFYSSYFEIMLPYFLFLFYCALQYIKIYLIFVYLMLLSYFYSSYFEITFFAYFPTFNSSLFRIIFILFFHSSGLLTSLLGLCDCFSG